MTVTVAPESWDVITVTGEEFLDTFAQIMNEWGFASSATPKCEPVRLPTLAEASAVLARSRYTALR